MDKEQMEMIRELMEVSFVLIETALYLNTHPNDEAALRMHNNASGRYSQLVEIYESRFGPLKNTSMSRYPWGYINEPWPWDMNFSI